MKQSYSPDVKFIVYLGTNKLRESEQFKAHGLEFEKGFVYKVTPEVAEYVKPIRTFIIVKGVKEGLVEFGK